MIFFEFLLLTDHHSLLVFYCAVSGFGQVFKVTSSARGSDPQPNIYLPAPDTDGIPPQARRKPLVPWVVLSLLYSHNQCLTTVDTKDYH